MNAKHTPGPWFVKYGTHIYAADGYETACADYAGNQHCEMDDNGLEISRGKNQSEANARLIAAAPELLESLQLISQWREVIAKSDIPAKSAILEDFDDARAVIAKATGA